MRYCTTPPAKTYTYNTATGGRPGSSGRGVRSPMMGIQYLPNMVAFTCTSRGKAPRDRCHHIYPVSQCPHRKSYHGYPIGMPPHLRHSKNPLYHQPTRQHFPPPSPNPITSTHLLQGERSYLSQMNFVSYLSPSYPTDATMDFFGHASTSAAAPSFCNSRQNCTLPTHCLITSAIKARQYPP